MDEDATVMCSAYLLRELIANLVDNSIQHVTGPGSVIGSVVRTPEATVLEITNSGPGIPEHQRERVFERFYRIDGTKALYLIEAAGLGGFMLVASCVGCSAGAPANRNTSF